MATPVVLSRDPKVLALVCSQTDKHSMGVEVGEASVFEMDSGLWVHLYGLGRLGSPWLGPPSGISGSFPPSQGTGQQVVGQTHPFSMDPRPLSSVGPPGPHRCT